MLAWWWRWRWGYCCSWIQRPITRSGIGGTTQVGEHHWHFRISTHTRCHVSSSYDLCVLENSRGQNISKHVAEGNIILGPVLQSSAGVKFCRWGFIFCMRLSKYCYSKCAKHLPVKRSDCYLNHNCDHPSPNCHFKEITCPASQIRWISKRNQNHCVLNRTSFKRSFCLALLLQMLLYLCVIHSPADKFFWQCRTAGE